MALKRRFTFQTQKERFLKWIVSKSGILLIFSLLFTTYFFLLNRCGIQCTDHYAGEIRNLKEYQNIDSFFDRVFIINMERSVKRRERMQNQMMSLGLTNYEFFKAVDGSKLDVNSMMENGELSKDAKLTSGEIGCALSHVFVWKEILKRNLTNALICEDDAKFDKNINKIATLAMRDVPNDWDIIHWFTHNHSHPLRVHIAGNVYRGYTESFGAVCYSVNQRGAAFLVKVATPLRYASDGIINWLTGSWTTGYSGYVILPTPVGIYRVKSVINSVDKENDSIREHINFIERFANLIFSN